MDRAAPSGLTDDSSMAIAGSHESGVDGVDETSSAQSESAKAADPWSAPIASEAGNIDSSVSHAKDVLMSPRLRQLKLRSKMRLSKVKQLLDNKPEPDAASIKEEASMELKTLKKTMRSLENMYSMASEKNEKLLDRNRELEAALKQVRAEKKQVDQKYRAVKRLVKSLEKDSIELEACLKEAEGLRVHQQVDEMKKQVEDLKSELAEKHALMESQTTRIAQLSSSLAESQARETTIKSETEAEISDLRKQLKQRSSEPPDEAELVWIQEKAALSNEIARLQSLQYEHEAEQEHATKQITLLKASLKCALGQQQEKTEKHSNNYDYRDYSRHGDDSSTESHSTTDDSTFLLDESERDLPMDTEQQQAHPPQLMVGNNLLEEQIKEWKQKAETFENLVWSLQENRARLRSENETLRKELASQPDEEVDSKQANSNPPMHSRTLEEDYARLELENQKLKDALKSAAKSNRKRWERKQEQACGKHVVESNQDDEKATSNNDDDEAVMKEFDAVVKRMPIIQPMQEDPSPVDDIDIQAQAIMEAQQRRRSSWLGALLG